MIATITGEKIVEALRKKLRSPSLTSLAVALGITNQAIQDWKNRKVVTSRQIAGLVDKARTTSRLKAEGASVWPLVEFFQIKKAPTSKRANFEIFSIIFSFAIGMASRKVCSGVLPKHQRP
jgi:hypothetical protein